MRPVQLLDVVAVRSRQQHGRHEAPDQRAGQHHRQGRRGAAKFGRIAQGQARCERRAGAGGAACLDRRRLNCSTSLTTAARTGGSQTEWPASGTTI